jgi:hypothetical protein
MTASETIINNFGYRDLNNAHLRYYSLMRYINYDNNWKKCVSINVSNGYYGNEINTIENASKYYYNKNIKNITDKELIALTLLLLSSTRYEIESNYSKIKVDEIFSKFIN